MSKQELHQSLWPSTFVLETNLASLIAEIRRALDDDAAKQGARLLGLPVLGTVDDLEEVAQREHVDVVVIAIPSLAPRLTHQIGTRASSLGLAVRHLPGWRQSS